MAYETTILGLLTGAVAKNTAITGMGSTPSLTRVADSVDPKAGRFGSATYRQNDAADPSDGFTLRVDWERLNGGAIKYSSGLWVIANRASSLSDKTERKNIIARNELIIPMGFGLTDDHIRRVLGQAFVLHVGESVDAYGVLDLNNVHTALLGTAVIY
jgi:hypothetical protein